jgi:uncharacterized protein YlxP (DUF503 family)
MPVAKLTVELSIPHAQSLKDRRQVVRSLKDKLRHGFNISSSAAYLTGQMREVDDALHRLANTLSAEILDSFVDLLDE